MKRAEKFGGDIDYSEDLHDLEKAVANFRCENYEMRKKIATNEEIIEERSQVLQFLQHELGNIRNHIRDLLTQNDDLGEKIKNYNLNILKIENNMAVNEAQKIKGTEDLEARKIEYFEKSKEVSILCDEVRRLEQELVQDKAGYESACNFLYHERSIAWGHDDHSFTI